MAASSDPVIEPLDVFRGARDHAAPQARLEEVRTRARKLREEMLSGPQVLFYKTCDLIRVPYPTRYALSGVFHAIPRTPVIHILNRLFIVQFRSKSGVKTLLFSPSDIVANAHTPFFKRMAESVGARLPRPGSEPRGVVALGQRLIAPVSSTVEEALAQTGIAPEEVDYISYDHLHTQDLRKWMGTGATPGYFPNARLLVMRAEWDSVQALLPPQRDWYCPGGVDGIDPDKVTLLDGSVRLGEGVALVATPGHTEGNHSLVAHTPAGLLVTSENGVGPDAYEPLHSEIAGVRDYARSTGMEVILNGNTLERGLDQYISMVLEKTLAGASRKNPAFPNTVASSELTGYRLFPGIKPTFNVGNLSYGTPQ